MEAARWAAAVIAVDRSAAVLDRARALARRRRVSNVTWQTGELEALPLPDACVDVALLSQALHHAQHPGRAVLEAARITVPGGRVLVLDLRSHEEEWVRAKLGDRRLGFEDAEIREMLAAAGLSAVKVWVGARTAGDPFTVLVASGTKPQGIHHEEPKGTKNTNKKKRAARP
jgi:ArsR family transcriptional regulator